MRALLGENKMREEEWPALLTVTQMILNQTASERLNGFTPLNVMTGLKHKQMVDLIFDGTLWKLKTDLNVSGSVIDESVESLRRELDDMHRETNIKRGERDERKEGKGEKVDFAVGDFVLKATIDAGKLEAKWKGPVLVVGVVTEWVYEVESIVTGVKEEVHVNRLRKYSERENEKFVNWERELKLSAEFDETPIVESIVGERRTGRGATEKWCLRVSWKGFEESDDTWEPIVSLMTDIPARVKLFVRDQGSEGLKKHWANLVARVKAE
jgi:hypothetical protein